MEIINEGTSTFPTLMCHELTDEPVDVRTGIHIICHPEFSSMADIFLFSPFRKLWATTASCSTHGYAMIGPTAQ